MVDPYCQDWGLSRPKSETKPTQYRGAATKKGAIMDAPQNIQLFSETEFNVDYEFATEHDLVL